MRSRIKSNAPGQAAVPPGISAGPDIGDSRYAVRFAATPQELDAVLKLRFEVFNLELGEGLDSSFATMRDEDEFDAQCHHLLIWEKSGGAVIATYRMQTREMAQAARGFYSQGEFDLGALPEAVLDASVEVGRACIAKAHRNGRVLFLLWKGIARYLLAMRKRYLFGCCSLTSQDPAEGKQVMDYLVDMALVWENFSVPPQPGFVCYPAGFEAPANPDVRLPRLFRIYLDYGARVCGPPAIDRAFKTIDYLVLLDTARFDRKTYEIFFR